MWQSQDSGVLIIGLGGWGWKDGGVPPLGWVIQAIGPCWEAAVCNGVFVAQEA